MLDVLTALAEPNRLKMIELIRQRPRSVGEISDLLNMRQPQASKHLQALHKVGLVHVMVFAQKRIYSLLPMPLIELENWLQPFLNSAYANSITSVKRIKTSNSSKKRKTK